MNRTKENAGYSFVTDPHYDLYVRQNCEPPTTTSTTTTTTTTTTTPMRNQCSGHGQVGPRGVCYCDIGYEGYKCDIENCENFMARPNCGFG